MFEMHCFGREIFILLFPVVILPFTQHGHMLKMDADPVTKQGQPDISVLVAKKLKSSFAVPQKEAVRSCTGF